jgi:hypothetical protein
MSGIPPEDGDLWPKHFDVLILFNLNKNMLCLLRWWLHILFFSYGCTALCWTLAAFSVQTPWMGDEPVARPLPTHRATQTQNKRTQTPMPWVWFEPATSVFKRTKTVHFLDRAASVIGDFTYNVNIKKIPSKLTLLKSCLFLVCPSMLHDALNLFKIWLT